MVHVTPSAFDPHGPAAHHTAQLAVVLFVMAGVVWLVVTVLIVFGGRSGRRANLFGSRDGTFIAVGGVVLPSAVLAVVAVLTIHYTRVLHPTDPPAGTLHVDVVGYRWWWDVQYPDLGIRAANEINVPVGSTVDITLTSADVVHSFWVPQLAGKVDAIPGDTNRLRLVAEDPGAYWGPCAEFCGLQHSNMAIQIVARTPDDFATWVRAHDDNATSARAAADPARVERGRAVFRAQPCGGCHRVAGTDAAGFVGPDLSDIGSRLELGAGVLANDAESMTRWIRDAPAEKPGAQMPSFALSADDLAALVAYLQSLDG